MSRRVIHITALSVAIGIVTWVAATANYALQAKPSAVAVIDVQKVFNDCKEKKEIDAKITSAAEQHTTKTQERDRKISQLQSDLELLDPGSPAWAQKVADIDRKVIEKEVETNYVKLKLGRDQIVSYEGLYRNLRSACAEVGRTNGYDIILAKEPSELLRSKSLQQIVNQIGLRKVMWATEEMDITNQVIQHMNNLIDAGQSQ